MAAKRRRKNGPNHRSIWQTAFCNWLAAQIQGSNDMTKDAKSNTRCGICLGLAVAVIALAAAITWGVLDRNPDGTRIAGGTYYDFNPWIQ